MNHSAPFGPAASRWGVLCEALSGVSQTVQTGSNPFAVKNNGATGFVLGGGIDIHAAFLHISPELRYTRWFTAPITDVAGLLQSLLVAQRRHRIDGGGAMGR